LSEIEKIRAKIKKLDDLIRLAGDTHLALALRERLEETEGVVDLIVFTTHQRISTKLTQAELKAIDDKISELIADLIAKANALAEG